MIRTPITSLSHRNIFKEKFVKKILLTIHQNTLLMNFSGSKCGKGSSKKKFFKEKVPAIKSKT